MRITKVKIGRNWCRVRHFVALQFPQYAQQEERTASPVLASVLKSGEYTSTRKRKAVSGEKCKLQKSVETAKTNTTTTKS